MAAASPPPPALVQSLDSLLGDFGGALQAAGGQPICFTNDFHFFDYGVDFQPGDSSLR